MGREEDYRGEVGRLGRLAILRRRPGAELDTSLTAFRAAQSGHPLDAQSYYRMLEE